MNKIKILIIILLIFLAIFGTLGFWLYLNTKKPVSSSSNPIIVEIEKGKTTQEIADNLADKQIINMSWLFSFYTKYKNKAILPGIYELSSDMNFDEILDILSQGKLAEKQITIIEGLRREEIADYLEKNFSINYNEFLEKTENLEGYLFPDTYRVLYNANAEDIIRRMTDNFYSKTKDLSLDYNSLILASIVEKEAKNDEERAKIAGVYKNRLESDMKLDADPTVQYAKGNWNVLTVNDYYNTASPYNTYLNKGLPPTPICNPGIKSIKAATNPEKHDYYYFLHLRDGSIVFSKTYWEHEQNILKYQTQL